jgi:hypothetical protein
MRRRYAASILLALPAFSVRASASEPIACHVDALSRSQRDRHQTLAEKLRSAIVEKTELANGYVLALDLSRLPTDAAGAPFCVVEVAEWVDLEARCCPFLDFGIDLPGKGGLVRLRLTGGNGVKAFLETEFPMLRAEAR